jgi:hypothetical protein
MREGAEEILMKETVGNVMETIMKVVAIVVSVADHVTWRDCRPGFRCDLTGAA